MSDFYPQFHHKEDHLLFDFGFSSALLMRSGTVLTQALEIITDEKLRSEIESILSAMRAFSAGRLQFRNEIYDAAPEAMAKIEGWTSKPNPS